MCTCRPKAYLVVTFRNSQVVSVERKHNRLNRDGSPQNCPMVVERLDPVAWLEGRT